MPMRHVKAAAWGVGVMGLDGLAGAQLEPSQHQ